MRVTTAVRLLPRCSREIGELKKELERQKNEAEQAKKALEDKIAEEMVLKGELDADEVRGVRRTKWPLRRRLTNKEVDYVCDT